MSLGRFLINLAIAGKSGITKALGYTPVNKAGDSMSGALLQADGTTAAPSYSFVNNTAIGMKYRSNSIDFSINNSNRFTMYAGGFIIAGGTNIQFTSGQTDLTSADLMLWRDGPGILAQRNGTNAQSERLYNTFTDVSNGEWLEFSWSGNLATIAPKANGTGTVRQFSLGNATGNIKQLYVDYTNTGTVGNVTINKAAGRVNLAAAGTQLTLTNSLITANSKVFLQAINSSGNAVAVEFYSVPGAGSATINAFPAVTNQTAIDFFVINTD